MSEGISFRVLGAARGYVGTPWRHLGRGAAGLDCIGLLLVAARQAGLALPEPPPYAREPQDQALRQALALHLTPIGLDDAAPGDVLLFNLGLYAGHVGIAGLHPTYGVASVVHAHLPRRAVVEEPAAPFRARLTGAYRWPEI